MISKAELLRWVKTLDKESCVGIDEGGLTLCEVLPDDTTGEAYIEVGGLPEECGPCVSVLMPGEACEFCGKVAEDTA